MPDQTDVEPTLQTPSAPSDTTAPAVRPQSEGSSFLCSIIALCSLAIVGCFFLPWIAIFLGTPSGYDLQQLPSSEVKLIWLIPVTALIAFFSAIGRAGVLGTSQLAGAMPFLALIYYCFRHGTDLLHTLQIGAYLTLALGAILFILPRFLEKPKS